MILQSFENPVWTVDQVGAVYLICIAAFIFVLYHVIDSLVITIKDIISLIKGWRNRK